MAQTHRISGVATNIRDDNGFTIVRYHATDVVTFNSQYIVLNTGGWETATTRTRMNQASNQYGLGYQVYQRDFQWFVDHNGKTYKFEGEEVFLVR